MATKVESPTEQSASTNSASHIRSRITVVCAECKRLKLKCDRRVPCGSCQKRDTIPRCVYSAQAAEKIDVQSLHNRILVLEAALLQRDANGGVINFNAPTNFFHDRTIIATGQSGSSVVISLDDVSGIWLDTLELSTDDRIVLRPVPTTTLTTATSAALFFTFDFNVFKLPDGKAGVTPALIHQLPTHPSMRDHLLDVLEYVMEMHPCVNWPHFKRRVKEAWAWADAFAPGGVASTIGIMPEEEEGSSSHHHFPAPRISLSFFAAMSAGLALAARIISHSSGTHTAAAPPSTASSPPSASKTTGSTPGAPSPSVLTPPPSVPQPPMASLQLDHAAIFKTSKYTYNIHEESESHDLDSITALLLQCLYLLHEGSMALPQTLFPLLGKMVQVARGMALWIDPEDGGTSTNPTSYGLFEIEMRRRMWWDVYYYDLFISDAMGFPPLIQDDIPTCRLPSDVNEEAFDPHSTSLPPPVEGGKNFTYFVIKAQLAQLVKNMKKRTFRSPTMPLNSEPIHAGSDLSIENAIAFESEIAAWLAEMPSQYKLDMLSDDPAELVSGISPILTAQRCEIAIVSSRLVIKLFVPFLKRRNNPAVTLPVSSSKPTPHHAVHACVNAAHSILHSSKILHSLFRLRGTGMPSTASESLFYNFARHVFDAGVIAAHSVISAPQSLFAKVALEDLRTALDILKDPMVSTGRGPMRGAVEGAPSEALLIMDLLKNKAEDARRGVGASILGTKRKHSEVDEGFRPGFHLPYVGSSVVTDLNPSTSTAAPPPPTPVVPSSSSSSVGSASTVRVGRSSEGRSRHDSGSRRSGYPAVGVRVRPGRTIDGGGRSRAPSISGVAGPKHSHHAGPSSSAHHPAPTTPMAPPSDPVTSGPYSAGGSQPPSAVTADSDYGIAASPTSFRSPEDSIMGHYNPQTPSDFGHHARHETSPGYQSSSAGSGGPPTGGGYFMPHGAPAYGPPPGFDSSVGPHAHTHVPIPLMTMSQPRGLTPYMHGPHTAMDTSGGGGHDSVPSTPHETSYADKIHLPLPRAYKPDQEDTSPDPMGSLGYPPGHGPPVSGHQWSDASGHYPQNPPPPQGPQPQQGGWTDGYSYQQWKGQGS